MFILLPLLAVMAFHSPKGETLAQSWGTPMRPRKILSFPPKSFVLVWSHPWTGQIGAAFNVYTNNWLGPLAGWKPVTMTTGTNYPFVADQPACYFRVQYTNIDTRTSSIY